jgi:KUP system potassium uptake protein
MADGVVEATRPQAVRPRLAALSAGALGVVFGDIGTSPLYTLKTVLAVTGEDAPQAATLGSLSLIIWTLIIVTSVKYVALAMRVNNDGEGGILALMSLLGIKQHQRKVIVLVGLFGAALIYGDGALTPAISVLSALEGLDIITPAFHRFVLPGAVVILVALFAVQRRGTARIGGMFGPIMAVWFAVMALLGIWGIWQHPSVLVALNPLLGLGFVVSGGAAALPVLGAVFLCVTGAEALYADMGQFGASPIRLAWGALVFPSLVLNYAGQAALVLSGAPTAGNIFFRLCPSVLLVPMVVLATVATIIASQSIITGAFSMTRQAIQLGWLPRLHITQTSAEGYGQIYVGVVNWFLMVVTLGLTIGFQKSDNLTPAYGIAVSMTMLMTSVLLFLAMREILGWSMVTACAVAIPLIIVDATFVVSNMLKVADGGYIPLLLAGAVYSVMMIWHRGAAAVAARVAESVISPDDTMELLDSGRIARVPGAAVFLTRTETGVPPIIRWHLKHNRSLHERVFIFSIATELVPFVDEDERLTLKEILPGMWRARARYGFMEHPDVPALVQKARAAGCDVDTSDVTYFVGHETVVRREDGKGLPRWVEAIFAFLQRNSVHITDYFRMPPDTVVEIGREIVI